MVKLKCTSPGKAAVHTGTGIGFKFNCVLSFSGTIMSVRVVYDLVQMRIHDWEKKNEIPQFVCSGII